MVATFTEKAAKELVSRISTRAQELGVTVNLSDMYLGTLHSIFLRILEEYRQHTALKRNYRVLDDFEQKYLIYRNESAFNDVQNLSQESQLLFTSHNQELLDSGLLRDDEIWFCNKTAEGASRYNSITDYTGIRKETSRKKLYQADKFGALPNIDINALRELFRAKKNR